MKLAKLLGGPRQQGFCDRAVECRPRWVAGCDHLYNSLGSSNHDAHCHIKGVGQKQSGGLGVDDVACSIGPNKARAKSPPISRQGLPGLCVVEKSKPFASRPTYNRLHSIAYMYRPKWVICRTIFYKTINKSLYHTPTDPPKRVGKEW